MSITNFLFRPHPYVPVFYILPKIYKEIFLPVRRPITSGLGGLLEPLAQFLDFHLQNFVCCILSYIKVTKHLVQQLEGRHISVQSVLITLGVMSFMLAYPTERIQLNSSNGQKFPSVVLTRRLTAINVKPTLKKFNCVELVKLSL